MLGVLFLWGGPGHAAGRPAVVGAWVVVGLAALAATVTWLALPSRRSMLPLVALVAAGSLLGDRLFRLRRVEAAGKAGR